MTRNRFTPYGLLLLSVLALSGCQTTYLKLPVGVTPVQATWLYGTYIIPAAYTNGNKPVTFQQNVGEIPWVKLATSNIKPGSKVPVILYLHGCKGISHQAELFSKQLVSQGYAFFIPDSFKRPWRSQCGAQGNLNARVRLRTEEVEYALEQIKKLPWVDQNRLILMGFSEGGNTVDNWSKPGFSAHIIVGSACTLVGGKPAAPAGTPVLAIVGSNDEYRPGKSCRIDESDGISKSVVIQGAGHSVAQYPQAQKAIRSFLLGCCL
ncbi:MAG: hypothetical protein Kow006_10700 [Gammaproteobacteria bacterium]